MICCCDYDCFSLYCALGPFITIFLLDSYSIPYEKKSTISGIIMIPIIFCLSFDKCFMVLIILSKLLGNLLTIGMIYLVEWLNSSVAGLGSPGPSGVVLICNKVRCILHLVSLQFLIVCFMNLMHASLWPLFWWWYDNDDGHSMSSFMQNFSNLFDIKLQPASDIIFMGKTYSEKNNFMC